jgi:type I restriction enzyme S subunit
MSFAKYMSYTDSGIEWLGKIPSDWRVTPLKAVATCNDDVLPESTDGDALIEYVEISGVEEGRGITETETLSFGAAPSRARRVVKHGDVLISTVRTYLRAIATVSDPPENLIASTGFAAIRPRHVHPGFVGYLLHSEYLMSEVIARSVGISYPAINASELMRLKGPIPSQEEQLAIATFLDRETAKIDALVEEQRRLIELLKEKRQAVISQAVTKGLDPGVPMKDSGVEWLGKVPAHWGVAPLKYVVTFKSGGTPEKNRPDYWDGDIPWASAKDLKVDLLRDTGDHISEIALAEGAATLVSAGAVLVVVRGMILARTFPVVTASVAMAINQDLKAVTALAPSRNDWLAWVLRASTIETLSRLDEAGHGTKALRMDAWGDMRVAVPPCEEQERIASFLRSECVRIDSLVSEADQAITLFAERRSTLISAAVTGKIDVRGLTPQ